MTPQERERFGYLMQGMEAAITLMLSLARAMEEGAKAFQELYDEVGTGQEETDRGTG